MSHWRLLVRSNGKDSLLTHVERVSFRHRDRLISAKGANQLVGFRYEGAEHEASRLALGAGANSLLYGFLAAASTVRAWAGIAVTENVIGFIQDMFPFKLR